MVRLARAEATGSLTVFGESELVLDFAGGAVVRVTLDDETEPLGQLLGIPLEVQQEALASCPPFPGAVGKWLVRHGWATEDAVAEALFRQARGRLARGFRWPEITLGWEADEPRRRGRLPAPIEVRALLLPALREALRTVSARALRGLDRSRWRLTPSGRAMLSEGAPLYPDEAALVELLGRGATEGDALLGTIGSPLRATRALYGWQLLGWVSAHDPASRAHGLLLRKQRQLRRNVGRRALLDLAPDERPRRALRRLAKELHPDRFDDALRSQSQEVLRELVRAEASMRD